MNPLSQVKSLFPALKNPANRHRPVGFTPEEFHYAFTNTLSAEESRAVWEKYHIPAPGNWVWEYGLFANFKPGHQATWVDYSADRAPLLLSIAGGEDHIMPSSVNAVPMRSATRSRRLSPKSSSSRGATTGRVQLQGGKRSPTMHFSGLWTRRSSYASVRSSQAGGHCGTTIVPMSMIMRGALAKRGKPAGRAVLPDRESVECGWDPFVPVADA